MILIERILFELRFDIVMMMIIIMMMIFMMTITMMILIERILFEPRFAIDDDFDDDNYLSVMTNMIKITLIERR